jgi:hypothetical protein
MKTFITFCVLAVFGTAIASFSFADSTLTLAEAIARGKVQATVLPFGDKGYTSGLRVEVKNISGKSIRLTMPKGTIFVPDNTGEQTLVTSGDEVFALNEGQTKQIVRMGFCTELHDHGSEATSTFQLSVTKNADLLNVLSLIDSLHITDQDFIQHSVWSITDRSPVGYVEMEADTAKARIVRERICALTQQEMPWYNTESEIVRTPEQEFVIEAKEVTGEIVINSDVPITLQGQVKDSNGKVLYTNPNQSHAPDGETIFDYTLHVEGWAKGTYYVVYTCNGKEVINQPFEI